MMPVKMPGANLILNPPDGMEDCEPLEILKHEGGLMSCWEVSPEDLAAIQETGRIYLNVLCAPGSHPPVWVSTDSMNGDELVDAALMAQKAKAQIH